MKGSWHDVELSDPPTDEEVEKAIATIVSRVHADRTPMSCAVTMPPIAGGVKLPDPVLVVGRPTDVPDQVEDALDQLDDAQASMDRRN